MDPYKFTPDQVKTIIETLMQFPAAKVYDTIKMMDHEISKQNSEKQHDAKPLVEQ